MACLREPFRGRVFEADHRGKSADAVRTLHLLSLGVRPTSFL